MTHNYKIREFNTTNGTMVIEFDGIHPINFWAPNDGTSYLSGQALEDAIQALYPSWEVEQREKAANLTGAEAITALVEPTVPALTAADIARNLRNQLLYQSDWTQIPGNSLTTEQQAAWGSYRQALRDVSNQAGFPDSINWPIAP